MSAVGSAKGSNGNSKDLLERVGLFTAEEENGAMLEKRKSFRLQNGEKFAERIDGRVIAAIVLWYFWSGCTLFLNKYLIDLTDGDAAILSCFQLLVSICLGFVQRTHSLGMYKVEPIPNNIPILSKDNLIIGSLRFVTVFLGLYALKYVEVSFTETVKSTAPAFTLLLSSVILGEKTSFFVKLSTLPVMGGLALCSATEAKFNIDGFLLALATNISECLQNVLSKKMLSMQVVQLNPGEIQYLTAAASLMIQLPTLILFATAQGWTDLSSPQRLAYYLINGICFHFQTWSGYVLMDAVSPVTHSVANVAKRAILIWVSVMIFKNTITLFSGLGTAIVFFGVLMYNKARQ